MSPVQHTPAFAQGRPAVSHVGVGLAQRLAEQVNPALHCDPEVQHICPSAPHGGAAGHCPDTQFTPAGQAFAQRPQLRESLVVSWQVPPQHDSPAPVHTDPAQQACPDAPQVMGGRAQSPDWHCSPDAHCVPVAQQACPSAPQTTLGLHLPRSH